MKDIKIFLKRKKKKDEKGSKKDIFLYMNISHTNRYNKKLQSPSALNIQETTGYKQKENVKK